MTVKQPIAPQHVALHRIVLLFSLIFLASCGDDKVLNVTELPRGTMLGSVILTSNDTTRYDLSGVTVKLDGTAFSTQTDALGKWKLENVPSRTYNITFEKGGFGYTKLYSFGFLGGVPITVPVQSLYRFPKCSPIFDNVIVMDSTQFQLNAHLPCGNDNTSHYIVYFLGNNPDVSYKSGKHQFSIVGGAAGTGPASVAVSTIYFQPGYPYADSKLKLRDSIYAVAYAIGGYTASIDPVTGEAVYPSLLLETSRRLTFTLPFDR